MFNPRQRVPLLSVHWQSIKRTHCLCIGPFGLKKRLVKILVFLICVNQNVLRLRQSAQSKGTVAPITSNDKDMMWVIVCISYIMFNCLIFTTVQRSTAKRGRDQCWAVGFKRPEVGHDRRGYRRNTLLYCNCCYCLLLRSFLLWWRGVPIHWLPVTGLAVEGGGADDDDDDDDGDGDDANDDDAPELVMSHFRRVTSIFI